VLGASLVLADETGDSSVVEDSPGKFKVTVRLFVFDRPEGGGEGSIRDIKEQEIYAGDLSATTPERIAAFCHGLDAAFRKLVNSGGELETLMPHDLLTFQLLHMPSFETAEDFETAMLRKGRLGRWIRGGVPGAAGAAGSSSPPPGDDAL
jgi:hypothetical protein